jgi:hypothetical protein
VSHGARASPSQPKQDAQGSKLPLKQPLPRYLALVISNRDIVWSREPRREIGPKARDSLTQQAVSTSQALITLPSPAPWTRSGPPYTLQQHPVMDSLSLSLPLSLPTMGYRIEDLHPVALLRIFYLAASLFVYRDTIQSRVQPH